MQDVAHIGAVDAVGPMTLAVTWGDGSVSHVNLAGWIARGGRRFAALGNALIFNGATVGLYGGNVTWDDDEGDLAIDSEHLRMISEHQAPFDATAAARWQEDMQVSNVEVADLLGIAPSTWAAYKAGAAIPSTVARLCRAMRSEPVSLSAHLRPRIAGNPGKGPVCVDPSQKARLRWRDKSVPVTQDWPTLRKAVLAFYRLPEEKQDSASIVLAGVLTIYKASTIRRLDYGPRDDGQTEGRSALTA